MNTKKHNQLLKTLNLNDILFKEITAKTLSDIEYIYLSSNQSLNQNQINFLFMQNIDNVNINLLRNKNCPKNKIEEFLTLNDKIYNIAISHNEDLDIKIYDKLLSLNDIDVTTSLEYAQSIKKGL